MEETRILFTISAKDRYNSSIMSNMTYCDGYENVINLSNVCVNSKNVTLFECIQNNDDIKSVIRLLMGIWASLITVCGTAGNLLTVLAIPHAAKHKRFIVIYHFVIINY